MSFGIPVRNGLAIGLTPSTTLSSGRVTRPKLLYDFLSTTAYTLDPRITFSRGSQAMVTDATGKLTYAPNNLLTNSESFEVSAWAKSADGLGVAPVVTANAGLAPDGTTTADRIRFSVPGNTNNASDYSTLVQIPVGSGTAVISSVWMRSNTGVNQTVFLRAGDNFVIQTVTPTWQRFAVAQTSAASANTFNIGIRGSVTPNITSADILVWGAQLEAVTYQTTPSPYVSTTPKNLLGYTQEFDNAAWTKSNAFVQTNLLTYSEQFDNASWVKSAVTVTPNVISAPDGTSTADKLINTNTSSGVPVSQSISKSASSTQYTASVYVKKAEWNSVGFYMLGGGAFANRATVIFNLETGAISTPAGVAGTFTNATATITNAGNGWYRITLTATTGPELTVQVNIYPANNGAFPAGDGTSGIYIWGAQLVQGSTPGNYQPTYAAAAAVQYVAPDGSRTAELMNATAGSVSPLIFQNTAAVASSAVISFYAKAGTYGLVQISSEYGSGYYANFDLNNGVVGSRGASCTDSTITALGNGWYRISATLTAYDNADISLIGSTTATIRQAFTAAGTETVYIWGAQLSDSASVDPYVYNPVAAPSSTAYYGPRFDYDPVTLAPRGLLIEEQRTNLLVRSEEFDNASWTKLNATVTANATTSPDGTVDADFVVADTTNAQHGVYQAATAVSGTTYTHSVYAKAGGYNWLYMTEGNNVTAQASFNLATGALGTVTGTGSPSATITPVGNGWYRCTLTLTPISTVQNFQCRAANANGGGSFTGDGTSGIFVYGAQLETGSFATSYIPTAASTVTRSADVALMQGANFSNWYNQSEGTFVSQASTFRSTGDGFVYTASDGTTSNLIGGAVLSGTTTCALTVVTGGSAQAYRTLSGVLLNTSFKIATAVASNNANIALNGSIAATDDTVLMPAVNRLNIGYYVTGGFLNGHIRSISYYNTRLPNLQLQALTS